MKYGESTFDILYLLFALLAGIFILYRRRDVVGKLMGAAALILGGGDAFHLIPRVLNYFTERDLAVWLGIGKLITSVTMTLFYLLMYFLWRILYEKEESKPLSIAIYALTVIRIVLCLLPQNGWMENNSPLLWAILRNIPFAALGGIVVYLYFKTRNEIGTFRFVWLLVTMSFLFYTPVAVAAGLLPILGMLMLPKTVCYIILIAFFWRYACVAILPREDTDLTRSN